MTGSLNGGGPDCERRRAAFPAEPVNALSSLAFVPASAVLAARARRLPPGDHAMSVRLLAGALAANGIGSAWYHAHHGPLSRWSHDAATSALLWLLAIGAGPPALRRKLAGLTVIALAHATAPKRTVVIQGAMGAMGAAAAVAAVEGNPHRDEGWRPARRARTGLAALTGLASLACYAAGRTGSRWCRPDSVLQPHAAWHVLAAATSTLVALEVADARGAARSGPPAAPTTRGRAGPGVTPP